MHTHVHALTLLLQHREEDSKRIGALLGSWRESDQSQSMLG